MATSKMEEPSVCEATSAPCPLEPTGHKGALLVSPALAALRIFGWLREQGFATITDSVGERKRGVAHAAAVAGRLDVLKFLHAASKVGFQPLLAKDSTGVTPLMLACYAGAGAGAGAGVGASAAGGVHRLAPGAGPGPAHEDCVRFLVACGGRPALRAVSDNGSTCMSAACYGASPRLVELLAAAGAPASEAQLRAPDTNNRTPAWWALQRGPNQIEEATRVLQFLMLRGNPIREADFPRDLEHRKRIRHNLRDFVQAELACNLVWADVVLRGVHAPTLGAGGSAFSSFGTSEGHRTRAARRSRPDARLPHLRRPLGDARSTCQQSLASGRHNRLTALRGMAMVEVRINLSELLGVPRGRTLRLLRRAGEALECLALGEKGME